MSENKVKLEGRPPGPLTGDRSIDRSCVRSFVDHETLSRLQTELTSQPSLLPSADIFAMLADPTRLKILFCLSRADELCVCDLADILGFEISTISHQLRRLRDTGYVKKRRDGVTIYYSLADDEKAVLATLLMNIASDNEPAAVSVH